MEYTFHTFLAACILSFEAMLPIVAITSIRSGIYQARTSRELCKETNTITCYHMLKHRSALTFFIRPMTSYLYLYSVTKCPGGSRNISVIFLTLFLHFSSCSPSFQYSGIDGPLLVEDLTRNEAYWRLLKGIRVIHMHYGMGTTANSTSRYCPWVINSNLPTYAPPDPELEPDPMGWSNGWSNK